MKELVEFIASSLVDEPATVQVTESERDDLTVFELRVAKEDLGKVIGKQGRTARAIRSLLTASASQLDKKARLEILE
ncbi:MAG: KH domain-containing protein [Proteobacteria bacterium]|nr:KH domain-containing protein [Pseudomonadota bacterium]MBU1714280.1 KH domain-containing protein [Pseudomonadota bacterium]